MNDREKSSINKFGFVCFLVGGIVMLILLAPFAFAYAQTTIWPSFIPESQITVHFADQDFNLYSQDAPEICIDIGITEYYGECTILWGDWDESLVLDNLYYITPTDDYTDASYLATTSKAFVVIEPTQLSNNNSNYTGLYSVFFTYDNIETNFSFVLNADGTLSNFVSETVNVNLSNEGVQKTLDIGTSTNLSVLIGLIIIFLMIYVVKR